MRPNRFVTSVVLAFAFSVVVAGCFESDRNPSNTNSPSTTATLQPRADGFCDEKKGQYIDSKGYCACDAQGTKFDSQSGDCIQCTASCDGKQCGNDGCQGTCGSCAQGEVCPNGTCVACEPNCAGKTCDDDGCGHPCGTCNSNETCVNDQCVNQETGPRIVTPCNCNTAPPGAYPGAYRVEPSCPIGVAQFELCDGTCAFGGTQWREVCSEGLECGTVVQACTCAFINASPGQIVQAPMCGSGLAQLGLCNFYCGPGYAWGAVCTC